MDLTVEELKVTGCIYTYVSNWMPISDYLHMKDWKSAEAEVTVSQIHSEESPSGWLQNYTQFGHAPTQTLNSWKMKHAGEWKNISSMENDNIRNHAQLLFSFKKILTATNPTNTSSELKNQENCLSAFPCLKLNTSGPYIMWRRQSI